MLLQLLKFFQILNAATPGMPNYLSPMSTGCVEYPTFCQTSQASEGGEEKAENMQIANML